MLSSMIGKWVGDRVAKTPSFAIGKSNNQEITQPEAANANAAQQKVSKLKALEKRIGDVYCEGSDFIHGFKEGINPLTPFSDFVSHVLKSPATHCGDGKSFIEGKIVGSQTGLFVDTLLAADGGIKVGGGVACLALSSGGCAPVATPAIAIGTSEVAAAGVMGVGHGGNYLLASKKKEGLEQANERSFQTTNHPIEKERIKNPEKSESPVWKNLKPYKGNRKTNGLSGKGKEFYEWDHTHNDIEIIDRYGKHLGSMDPLSGKRYKSAVTGRPPSKI